METEVLKNIDQVASSSSCSNTIVLFRALIPNYSAWKAAAGAAICRETSTRVYFNLELIAGDEPKREWLRVHGPCIDFPASYVYIESEHLFNPRLIESHSGYKEISLGDFINEITAVRYSGDCYQQYIEVQMGSGSKPTFIIRNGYDENAVCYSVPFFRSVVTINELNNDSVLEFAAGKVNGRDTVFIRVKQDETTYCYYDFSHIPPHLLTLN